jgi:hypothetical protein
LDQDWTVIKASLKEDANIDRISYKIAIGSAFSSVEGISSPSREALEEMEIGGITSARSLWREESAHAFTLMAFSVGLFFVLGSAGLLIDQIATALSAEREVLPSLELGAKQVESPKLLRAGPSWLGFIETHVSAEETSGHKRGAVTELQEETPLVLVASGLAIYEEDPSQELLLEPDGSLRLEGSGVLVGFLQSGERSGIGDTMSGPGQMEFRLLHHRAWVSEHVRVPVVESSIEGEWIVKSYRAFGVGIQAEDGSSRGTDRRAPELNSRTGLPQMELISQER